MVKVTNKGLLDTFVPPFVQSNNFKEWITNISIFTCIECLIRFGMIYSPTENSVDEPPIHVNCHCITEWIKGVFAGDATNDGSNGADWWIATIGQLPDYYISKDDIALLGWRRGKSPAQYAPGKMIYGGVYKNFLRRLPGAPGRVWYEADINYYFGKRNGHRVVYSNDGLIFATYDHYLSFHEVIID